MMRAQLEAEFIKIKGKDGVGNVLLFSSSRQFNRCLFPLCFCLRAGVSQLRQIH